MKSKSNEVTILRNGVVYSGEAVSMHDEKGDELLLMKVTNKTGAKKHGKGGTPTVKLLSTELKDVPPNAKRVICKNAVVEFNSMTEAAEMLCPDGNAKSMAAAISSCCNGRIKHVRGLEFEYAN